MNDIYTTHEYHDDQGGKLAPSGGWGSFLLVDEAISFLSSNSMVSMEFFTFQLLRG